MLAADFNAMLTAHAGSPLAAGRNVTKKVKRATPEEDLHRAVFEWIFLNETRYPELQNHMHCPNGGARSKGEAGKLKAMGVRKGVSDVINPFPSAGGAGFACELKAPSKKPTSEQALYLETAASHGWVTGVCYTLEQFVALTERYLGVKTRSSAR